MVSFSLRIVLIFLSLLCFSGAATGQSLYLRHPAPSPDGSRICFGFQGDLWIVSAQGGRAERLTVHVGYDGYPSWSPDGRLIAFSSDRNGNFDVFTIAVNGGVETQLTSHSNDDIVSGWSADSRAVFFHASRNYDYDQVWQIPAKGGHERPLTQIESFYGRPSADGGELVFTRGATPWWQKGYRGSAGCDLFLKDLSSGNIERLTSFSGNDLNGFLIPSGSELIYLSDSTGNYNLFRRNLVGGSVVQMTNHRLDVFQPSLSADGSLVAYETGGEIYVYELRSNQGRRLQVEIAHAAKRNDLVVADTDSGFSEYAVSPDGRQVALIIEGDVFCLDLNSGQSRRLTNTAAAEAGVAWSSDATQLAFVGRDGDAAVLRLASSNEAEEPLLALAHEFHFQDVLSSDRQIAQPTISPELLRVAFVRGRVQLVVADIKKLTERVLTQQSPVGEYDWSPDGRYIAFTQLNGDWLNELFIGDTESGSVERISAVPGHFRAPRFSADGRILYFLADGDLHYVYLDGQIADLPAYERRELFRVANGMNTSPLRIDFEGIAGRAIAVDCGGEVVEAVLAADGATFVLLNSRSEILTLEIESPTPRQIAGFPAGAHHLRSSSTEGTISCLDHAGRMHSLDLTTGEQSRLPLSVPTSYRRSERFQQVFDECWRAIKERFYDEAHHGVNWNTIRESYAPRLQHLTELRDFQDLLREMMGQLKASHLDLWLPDSEHPETGMLGFLPDYTDNAAGMIALEIAPESPAARKSSEIRAFDKITAVEGQKLENDVDPYRPFLGTARREVRVDLINRSGISRSVTLTPLTVAEHRRIIDRQQTDRARERVDKVGGGRIGYVRATQMTPEALERFMGELRQYGSGKQALIVDVRGNSGGSEHDRFLQLLARKQYITHKPRTGVAGEDAPLAVPGPVALLVDERTSSDAEILAQGFRELKIGEIIGVTTHGAVIGTEVQPLLDGSTLKIPTVGWFTLAGQNLENHGVSPDVAVPRDLNRADRGEDNQLDEAIQRVKSQLK